MQAAHASGELLQERGIVFDEVANVVHVVLLHRDALGAEAERPARHIVGIVTPRNTLGCTIPEPPSSIQPVPLHVWQPVPPQPGHDTSTSALGSVNGKNDGRKRTSCSGPNSARIIPVNMPLR